jgi:hypothetical protein
MSPGRFRGSYLVSAWATRANQIAVLVTLAAVIGVAALSRAPLSRGFELDLRERDRFGGLRQVTLLEFSQPTRFGRNARGPTARAVLNRPLPASFILTIEGRSLSSQPSPFEVIVGSSEHGADFGRSAAVRAFAVENPTGSREITFRSRVPTRPLELAIRSISVE